MNVFDPMGGQTMLETVCENLSDHCEHQYNHLDLVLNYNLVQVVYLSEENQPYF